MVADSHSPTYLAIATANAILLSLGDSTNTSTPANIADQHLGGKDFILSLGTDLQNILGDAMGMATAMFLLKATTHCKAISSPITYGPIQPYTISTSSVTAPKPSAASPY